jgi:hypothetical protein
VCASVRRGEYSYSCVCECLRLYICDFFLHFMNIDELLLYTSGMACTYVCGQYKESSYGCITVLISINMTCYVAYKCSNFYHYGTCSLI